MDRRFLQIALRMHYLDPGLALWRAMELDALSRLSWTFPLLDLGSGNGLFGFILLDRNVEEAFDDYTFHYLNYKPYDTSENRDRIVVGLDINYPAVNASRSLPHYRVVINGDARDLPFPDEFFASVISNCTLEHISGIDHVLGEVARVLRKGGIFAFTVPSSSFGNHLLGSAIMQFIGGEKLRRRYIERVNEHLAHWSIFSIHEWNVRLEAVGLQLVDSLYYLPPRAELIWDILYSLSRFGITGVTVGAVLGRLAAILMQAKVLFLKRAWCLVLERLLERVYVPCSTQGGGLMIIARKERRIIGNLCSSKS